jgi:hypothetical protein
MLTLMTKMDPNINMIWVYRRFLHYQHHIGKLTPGICVCLVKEERPPVGSKPFLDGVG